MKYLTDDNPYDILGVTPDADKKAIKQAFARQNASQGRDGKARRAIRQAYDILRAPDKRLIVDALTPGFSSQSGTAGLAALFTNQPVESPDWLAYLDEPAIVRETIEALVRATLLHTISGAENGDLAKFDRLYDGLDDFLKEWLE